MAFARFYLDKEKDICVTMDRNEEGQMAYVLTTPNHSTGNLIRNLAALCNLPLTRSAEGYFIIQGIVPAYYDGNCRLFYLFSLGDREAARIESDGHVHLYVQIPAIAKTLMSQTRDYQLSFAKTIVRTRIPAECKFRTDLHTHMNATLSPDQLIALGIVHQIRYSLYYIRKLHLRLRPEQEQVLRILRTDAEAQFLASGSTLTGKYKDRKINDNVFINFADLILNNLENAEYNIPRIRASLAIMKDSQAVFTNLEKVYLYRYVFAKGVSSSDWIPLHDIDRIPDPDIAGTVKQMLADHQTRAYRHNTLFQDKMLWTARNYQHTGIRYVEMSDTTLVKPKEAIDMLGEVHAVMPAIYKETGVRIRFLAALRRIPLTIVKDQKAAPDYMVMSLKTLKAVAVDPYVAGSDIVGEEINDIRDLSDVIADLTAIAKDDPYFVIRIHAGENDSLHDNVGNSVRCVQKALAPGQKMPHIRIGHGLYTPGLNSQKGKELLALLKDNPVTVEFQITSNVRLNNLSSVKHHPLKQYLKAGIPCVQGTDGGAIYGTDSLDEQLALATLLGLSVDEQKQMCAAEEAVLAFSERAFTEKTAMYQKAKGHRSLRLFYTYRENEAQRAAMKSSSPVKLLDAATVLGDHVHPLPFDKKPIVICGGSFNNDFSRVRTHAPECAVIDRLLEEADPRRVCFIIGDQLNGYEKYLLDHAGGRFEIYAFVPKLISGSLARKLAGCGAYIRVGTEASAMGLYKSIAYEVFKHRSSILIAFEGNAAGENLIQEARNAKYETRIFVNARARSLRSKAASLQGYVTLFDSDAIVPDILKYTERH